jgi:hypothetical protein
VAIESVSRDVQLLSPDVDHGIAFTARRAASRRVNLRRSPR